MKEIPLTQGKVALVDDEDFEVLNAFKWCAGRDKRTFYVMRRVRRPSGGWTTEKMHRVILMRKLGHSLAKDEQSDHVNGDGLDNRRENLQMATTAQNQRNCHRFMHTVTSRYLGVCWHKHFAKWTPRVGVARKRVSLGYYRTESEAALAREFYIAAHPELQARSNFAGHELTL